MNSNNLQPTNEIRFQFTQAMSEMYQQEVPLYKNLISLANNVNHEITKDRNLSTKESQLLTTEHHGAIRVGTANELFMMRKLFSVMGMHAVDYYDLSVAGIPVHSTAFRALNRNDLEESPFRVFCSLLRLDQIDNKQLRQQAKATLDNRNIFPEELLKLIELSEKQNGLSTSDSIMFIDQALEVFRWHQNATVDIKTYEKLKEAHGLIADVISFKGPHINHLTPMVLNIDACQRALTTKKIEAKAVIEGPPKRKCPILLRQTSFIAIPEEVIFSDSKRGSHTARFGEIEERGVALTPKGRELYDKLLVQAQNENPEIPFLERLNIAFKDFPDSYEEIRRQGLAYFSYSTNINNNQFESVSSDIESLIQKGLIKAEPIVYEDFLPVSAAGIFASNLSSNFTIQSDVTKTEELNADQLPLENSRRIFEKALEGKIVESFDLYETIQQESINTINSELGLSF